MAKKIASIILAISIVACLFTGLNFTASAETEGYYTYSVRDGEATITKADSSISGDITIPSTLGGYQVTSIGYSAFDCCYGLTSIEIPNSVTSIDDYAFWGCIGLTSIEIPNSVTSIGSAAFSDCTCLTNITVEEGNGTYHSSGNCVIETELNELIVGCNNSIIPTDGSVTVISPYVFYNCAGLTSIEIPNSVTGIEMYAFWGCTGLTNITIPDSITWISTGAFGGCSGLTSIVVKEENPNYHSSENCLIETESKTLILGCSNSTIPNDGSVTSIGYPAFLGCTSLTSIEIPNSVTSIGGGAFNNCTGLTSIVIPSSVTSIGGSAFEGCTELNDVYFTGSQQDWNSISVYECNDGIYYAEIHYNYDPLHTHNYKWSSDKTYHWKVCSCGEINSKSKHTSDGGKVTKATLTKAGKKVYTCKVCKKVLKTETIAYPKSISLAVKSYTYNGKVMKPAVKVIDSNGKTIASSNYSVTYSSGCKNVGKYSVKITFKGNYNGTKTLYFTINPKGTTVSKLTKPKTKQIKVTWKTQATQTTGYQIQYSTSKTFASGNKTATVTSSKTTSKTLTGLTKGKTYYVRIRTYKTVGKTKYYSAWSKAKSIKTK